MKKEEKYFDGITVGFLIIVILYPVLLGVAIRML